MKLKNIQVVPIGKDDTGHMYKIKYQYDYMRYEGWNNNVVKVQDGEGHDITMSPFHNCQIYTIASFAQLLTGWENPLDALLAIQNKIGKTELMIDVNEVYCTQVEAMFNKDEIIFKQPYRNNTRSQMCIYLLQIQKRMVRYDKELKEEAAKAKAVKTAEELKAQQTVAAVSDTTKIKIPKSSLSPGIAISR